MNIRFVKQDPIVIQPPDDRFPEHLIVSSLTVTPSGRILVVDAWQGYTCIKMLDKEGQHLSDLAVPEGDYDITTANEEEPILLHWPDTKILIVDISTAEMSVKQKIEMDGSINAKYVSAFQDKIILSYWCYPSSVKMIDRNGNLIWSRSLDIIHMCPFFEVAPCIVLFFEDNNPKLIAANVEYPFLKDGLSLVKLDAKTGEVIKIKRLENLQPRGVDVDIDCGILYFLADHTVWGSTLDLEH